MVSSATGGMDQSAGDARNEELVCDLQLDDVIKLVLPLLEHRIQFLCLRDCPRETVQNEAATPGQTLQ